MNSTLVAFVENWPVEAFEATFTQFVPVWISNRQLWKLQDTYYSPGID